MPTALRNETKIASVPSMPWMRCGSARNVSPIRTAPVSGANRTIQP